MDGGRLMLRRGIHRVQDQWGRAGIDKLMLRTGGHDDEISGLDVLVLPIDGGATGAGREREDLINCVFLYPKEDSTVSQTRFLIETKAKPELSRHDPLTYLIANIPTNRHGHEHQLAIQAGEEHTPKIRALARETRRHIGEVHHLMLRWVFRRLLERHCGG